MNKYELRTNQKKNAIIQTALALFRTQGYTNTGIHEIASSAHVSPVSIYNYFGSKEGLVTACASQLLQGTNEMVAALLREEGSFKDKLIRAVTMCAEKPHEILEEYFTQEALEDQAFIALFQASVNDIRTEALSDFIACGKEEGAVNAAISTETILQFFSAAAGMQAQWETQAEHKEKAWELYQLILYGLVGRE